MTDVTTTRICNECGLAYRESLLPHQCAEWTRGRTEQSSTTEASETADLNTECAFIHALPSGSVRCGALRQHHSQYTGHKFTEPRPPAPRAGEWRTVGQVVPECNYKIAGMTVIQKSVSSELVALIRNREIAERILVEHNQHSTLVEQRDRALEALQLIQGFNWQLDDSAHGQEIKRRAESVIATIEPERET